jgi:hypothetical protein
MSLLTEDTIFTNGVDTHQIGGLDPSGTTQGFEKVPSQTGFFIYSNHPYSLWLKDTNGWTLYQTFSAANLVKATTYAWGDYTAAYVKTATTNHTVHLKPRTGAILVDGDIGDGVNQHDTLILSANSAAVNIAPSSLDLSAKSINDLDTKLYTRPVTAPGGYDDPVQDSVMFYDEDVTDGNHWKYRTGKSLVKDAVDINNNSDGKFLKWHNASDSFVWETPPSNGSSTMGGTMTSHIIPDTNAAYDLGNAEYKIRHLFLSDNSMYIGDTWIKAEGDSVKMPNLLVGDLNLNNTGRQNEVDGTSGHWSIQEGSEDLFLINRTTGKKYRFNITEVEEN